MTEQNPFSPTSLPSTAIWSMSGDQGNLWHRAAIQVNSSSPYQLSFVAILTPREFSDMAVDDISPTIGCEKGGMFALCFCHFLFQQALY